MSGTMDMAQHEPREIRASDTERQRVVATLQAACVDGRLDLDEYGQRVQDALAARTRAQLEALLIDLPAPIGVDVGRGIAPTSRPGVSTTMAVLGSAQRNGFWRLAEESRVIAVLGSSKIDLRSARISAAVTTLEVTAVLGSVDVIVPAGVEVELEVHAVLGSRDLRVAGTPPAPGAPVIRLTGIVLLGSLTVRDAAAQQAHLDAYG
jgi:hypothetical protein